MKTTVTEAAYAKLNLTLDVLEKLEDGYHSIKSIMQSVQLCDQVTLTRTDGTDVKLTSNVDTIPLDESNTAMAAVRAFEAQTGTTVGGLEIHIEKNIPVECGVGGGSSDAAAVLRGLNELYETNLPRVELAKIASGVGSDVPFCVFKDTSIVSGMGNEVEAVPGLSDCWFVLCKPDFNLSTAEMYERLDGVEPATKPDHPGMIMALGALSWANDIASVAKRVENVFEVVLTGEERDAVADIKETLLDNGALGAAMSGSGPMTFGIFDDEAAAKKAADALQAKYKDVFLTEPV
jgi:4-diphosphocytidyl-2-C-methyl-D-erythritol kinase